MNKFNFNKLTPFKWFVLENFPFIEADFDALTEWQLFCKLGKEMNKIINSENIIGTQMENVTNAFIDLQNYVNNYFDNLDVQEEINNKLNEMAQSGELTIIIENFLKINSVLVFNNIEDLKSSNILLEGSIAKTLGYYTPNDGGGAYYLIKSEKSQTDYQETLNNGLYATLIIQDLRPEYFGAYGDGKHNDSQAFIKMFNFIKANEKYENYKYSSDYKVNLYNTYNIDNINVENVKGVYIDGNNKGMIVNGGFIFPSTSAWKTIIENLIFKNCLNPINFEYLNNEYGKITISNCHFINCTGTTISIRRRSCQSLIKECNFVDNKKNVYVEDNDQFTFTQNWVECSSKWEDNHIDIEQYAPNEGMAIITNNFFIPGYEQSSVINPCWIKIGRSATIENNRFSGENATIYPILIKYDKFDTFNFNNAIQPIINIINNPIIAGKTTILMEKYAGKLNIKNNSFSINNPIIKLINDELIETYNNMTINNLVIDIDSNGGRTLNFRNSQWKFLTTARPVIPDCLDKFIKTNTLFALNKNSEIRTGYKTNTSIDIEINTSDIISAQHNPFFISGFFNPNPSGSILYRSRFLILVNIACKYVVDKVAYIPEIIWITEKPAENEFKATINGQNSLAPNAEFEKVVINLEYENTRGTETTNFIEFNNIINLADFMPVMLNKPSQAEKYNFQNLSN